jgi:hypothetical protein
VGSLGEGRDPGRPVRDQAITTVDAADGPVNGRIAQRAPLRGDRHSHPARQIILKDLRQIIFKNDSPPLKAAVEVGTHSFEFRPKSDRHHHEESTWMDRRAN